MPEPTEFIHVINAADGRLQRTLDGMRAAVRQVGTFALAIGSTETSDVDGISAAGADGESRRLTPAIDAEALALGFPVTAKTIPVSPAGIVSPVVLSRAMLNLLDCKVQVFDCGTFAPPTLDQGMKIGRVPAKRLDTGAALELDHAIMLFENGKRIGESYSDAVRYLVIGECVPAGTTTALGVLTALGYPAHELVSSSMPSCDHRQLRWQLVDAGIANAQSFLQNVQEQPLRAVAAVGDPMQPFVAGLALAVSRYIPVILAGGTQMLGVYALARAMAGKREIAERNLAVVTTKWVAFDQHSDAGRLAAMIDAPFAASCPDLSVSRHEGLRAYEDGNVKEGTGAGGLMALAHLAGFSSQRIVESIDLNYDRMVLARQR